ncbi:hypothetical protein E2C01_084234 [Portunus trituberculatus]|uniref:Uncharacterized protein n=1 Tax=Portunus trituberculatus TaxID=210409 RepID=A0A5B7J3G6_PORTR|nr:hypothetical protein [Portunus trituberculatus]
MIFEATFQGLYAKINCVGLSRAPEQSDGEEEEEEEEKKEEISKKEGENYDSRRTKGRKHMARYCNDFYIVFSSLPPLVIYNSFLP